jgi:hypothetical protein
MGDPIILDPLIIEKHKFHHHPAACFGKRNDPTTVVITTVVIAHSNLAQGAW